VDADHREVTTIDGLAGLDGRLHPLQAAMMDSGGLQCGFCTPGVIMSALGLLLAEPSPSETAVRKAIAGNLCRCTGYQPIIEAIIAAAPRVRHHGAPVSGKRRSRA
jgi:carbon-monoxide dehydrogenase small subunit